MHKFLWLALLCAVLVLVFGCAGTANNPANNPPNISADIPAFQPTLEVRMNNVFVGASGNAFTAPPLPTRQPITDGDRIRTDVDGIGLLALSCADVLVFGGSNLQLEQTTSSTLSASGAQLFSSTCVDIQVRSDQLPPEAVVQTHGTVFFVAYDPDKHITLLWTLIGTATLSNIAPNGQTDQTVRVPDGFWSVTRDRAVPDLPPHPVAEMGPIIDEMNLRDVYDVIVQLMETEGFGPSALLPQNVATIVPPTVTPTPTNTATNIPTDVPTGTPLPTIAPTITARPIPRRTNTRVPLPTATDTLVPLPSVTDTTTPLPPPTTAVPPPTTAVPPPPAPPSISFNTDRTTINQGESAVLRWDVDNVSAVYLDGEGVGGHASRSVQPNETRTYTLRVVLPDGSEQLSQVTITVNPFADGFLQGYVFESDSTFLIANAKVELSDGQTIFTVSDGFFEFSHVRVGSYYITASAPGYYSRTTLVSVTQEGSETWIGLSPCSYPPCP